MIKNEKFDILIVGAGSAGLAIAAKLLQKGKKRILWVDPTFTSGRLSTFPSVPSNTRSSLFIKYAESCRVDELEAVRVLKSRKQDKGCELKLASEMVAEAIDFIEKKYSQALKCIRGICNGIEWTETGWMVRINGEGHSIVKDVIFATGSNPRPGREMPQFKGSILNPETLLCPERVKLLKSTDVIGVVGSSHSAILVLKNLAESGSSSPGIVNFYRHDLKFAEYLADGSIKYDNTGLKGEAAEWTKNSDLFHRIKRVQLINEDSVYEEWLPKCTHLVWAIGYDRNPLPQIHGENGEVINVSDYDENQKLVDSTGKIIPNLYGIGIAFPERVLDVSGDVEEAVGLWKFIRTANKLEIA